MRITIEDDHPDRTEPSTAVAAGFEALDGGPAPVAELRRTGRVPDGDEHEVLVSPEASEGGAAPLNPLRHGAEVAAAQDE
jgi:hypothetical protein